MRSAVFARRLVVAITIGGAAMLLAGCGAASDNAGDIAIRPQRIQECTSQTYARVVDRLPAEAQKRVSRSKIRGAIHGFCAALAREGFLDSGNADYFRAIGVGTTLKNHPEIVRPYCRVLVDQSALTLPSSADRYLTPAFWTFYRREVCRVMPHYIKSDGHVDQEGLLRGNPNLFAPFCVAGGLDEYDSSLSFTRAEFKRRLTAFCFDAIRRGVMRASGVGQFRLVKNSRYYALLRRYFGQ